jgi:hypothetical protein
MTNEQKIRETLNHSNEITFVKMFNGNEVYKTNVRGIAHYFVMNNGKIVDHQID